MPRGYDNGRTHLLRTARRFVVGATLAALLVVRRLVHHRLAPSATGTLVARGFYLAIAVYGFVLLGMDVADFA